MGAIFKLLRDGLLLTVGDTGKTNQISDDSGRVLFEPAVGTADAVGSDHSR